jgi:hypothetical protein
MREKVRFVTLPALILLIFFLGKLVMSLLGAPYELGIQIFSMVTVQVHLALFWGAFSRRYHGYGIGGAIQVGILIALVSQILIVIGTAVSYPLGGTHFNKPIALNLDAEAGFIQAMGIRAGGLIANCVIGAVAAAIGWALGVLIPERAETDNEQHLRN